MKILFLWMFVATASAAVISTDGIRQRRDVSEIVPEYLPPAEELTTEAAVIENFQPPQESAVLGQDGYAYKTVRRLKYRQRRDVSEISPEYLPPVDYLPPTEESATEAVIEKEALQDSAVLADDGYQYKTVRRLKYRQRRDVSEISPEYLPPAEESDSETVIAKEAPEESAVLADDGYQYKTVRRLKYRQRRDVSEIAPEYLPPVEESVSEAVIAKEAPEESAVLADDGYQYKTVRRLKYRQRRDVSEISPEYLPPVEESVTEAVIAKEAPEESAVLADDGYQYKTVRRLKYRQRRDVSEISPEYLPPVEESVTEAVIAKEAPEESAVLADDGYQYKTVRRLKYRQRRDVSEISPEYLPPAEESDSETIIAKEAPEESAVLADDGYQYKTVRRLKYRQRRDVSEISPEYLPPVEESVTEAVIAKEAPEESAVLADDGYQYKTVRRLKYRQRRDVSEISPEYLPPVEESVTEAVIAKEAPEESAVLADDGYQYKTVRRLKYRQRRDVSEISPEYLPPVEESVTEAVIAKEAPEESAVLADDGYQYKTVRRLKYRQRRDVSEISPEYLPPVEESVTEAVIAKEAPEESAVLADDGYKYKTVRRLKYRQRRDVSEISPEYLPPVEESVTEAVIAKEAPEESAVLADDGYQYKTVRRLKYRHRRDVSEISPEYLPPVEESVTEAVIAKEAPEESAVLADDGYKYKTVRRLKYRQRRDVSEISPEYLPPVEESVTEAVIAKEAPEESAVLADDGYQYKTVRRLKYRQRRDVSEISPEYLPPVEESVSEAVIAKEAPEESAVLADDGYQYKTVRRLKYRQRRDVSEISPEYLPPVEESVSEAVIAKEAPEESAVLADDGYQYKTVRRLKYRQRRDVSEISPEYLPPVEESVSEAVIAKEAPEESAVLADDGYQYKTVRRLKYRQRRDVSEISPEYLPPVEESVTEAVIAKEAPEESAVLADDGYQYKTVRRLKYRQRRDVSEISPEYLPPVNTQYLPSNTEAATPVENKVALEESIDSAVLAKDGYHYKTVKRIRY